METTYKYILNLYLCYKRISESFYSAIDTIYKKKCVNIKLLIEPLENLL